jgi:iron complex outermembrane recepter protein
MSRIAFLRGVSAGALLCSFLPSFVSAQEALPAIDVGVDRSGDVNASSGAPAPTSALGSNPGGRITGYSATNATSALKMDTPIMETPANVQVVTRQTMDDQQVVSVRDALLTDVSGVLMTPNFAAETYKIRGFTNYGNSYKNGLFEYRMLNLDTTNLQSIEVLKGPAAMLYGRAEPGGILDLITKRPLDTPYYSIQEQAGTYGFTRTTVDMTGPVTKDKQLLYRFNGEFYSTGTYEDYPHNQNYFFAPSFTWRPNERFTANLDVEMQRYIWTGDFASLPAIGGYPAPIPISRYLSLPQVTVNDPRDYVKRRIAYDWTYRFDDNWSLTNRGAYSMFWMGGLNTYTSGINPRTGDLSLGMNNYSIAGAFHDYDFSTNLDLKGKFSTGFLSHSVLIGLDHMSEHEPPFASLNSTQKAINIYYPYYSYTLPINIYGSPAYSTQSLSWQGIYALDNISMLDDKVHVLLGGREDWASTSVNKLSSTSWAPKVNPLYSSYWAMQVSHHSDYNQAFSPKVGFVLQPYPWLSFFGDWSRSFGLNNTPSPASPNPTAGLPPQKGDQKEMGVKMELFDSRLLLTFAYFDIYKSNISTPAPTATNPNNSVMVGLARSQGVEFDMTGKLTDNLSAIVNFTHDDVRTMQGALSYNPLTLLTTQLAVAGTVLPASPKNYGNVWLKYDVDEFFGMNLRGLSVGGGVSVVQSSLGDNANTFTLPGYALLNGMIAYTTKIADSRVTAQLNIKNITNATYYLSSSGPTAIQTGTPRTILGSLRVEF